MLGARKLTDRYVVHIITYLYIVNISKRHRIKVYFFDKDTFRYRMGVIINAEWIMIAANVIVHNYITFIYIAKRK